MKAAEHIDKAAKEIADMIEHGHVKDDFKLAEEINMVQYGLQEAKRLVTENTEKGQL